MTESERICSKLRVWSMSREEFYEKQGNLQCKLCEW